MCTDLAIHLEVLQFRALDLVPKVVSTHFYVHICAAVLVGKTRFQLCVHKCKLAAKHNGADLKAGLRPSRTCNAMC